MHRIPNGLIVRIEFSPLRTIDVSNGHYYAMETTSKYVLK